MDAPHEVETCDVPVLGPPCKHTLVGQAINQWIRAGFEYPTLSTHANLVKIANNIFVFVLITNC